MGCLVPSKRLHGIVPLRYQKHKLFGKVKVLFRNTNDALLDLKHRARLRQPREERFPDYSVLKLKDLNSRTCTANQKFHNVARDTNKTPSESGGRHDRNVSDNVATKSPEAKFQSPAGRQAAFGFRRRLKAPAIRAAHGRIQREPVGRHDSLISDDAFGFRMHPRSSRLSRTTPRRDRSRPARMISDDACSHKFGRTRVTISDVTRRRRRFQASFQMSPTISDVACRFQTCASSA